MPPCQGGERRFESGREDMYDISKINTIGDLESLIADLDMVIKDKETRPAVRAECQATKKEAQKKLKVIRSVNGL